MPAVSITLLNDDVSPAPIVGSVIEFYTTVGVFETGGTTDSNGVISVSLPTGFHDILFYKAGVSILPRQPQRIEVLASPSTNNFTVTGHIRTREESLDPTRCTVSGFLINANGIGGIARLVFSPRLSLITRSGNPVIPGSSVDAASNDTGYIQFELLRGIEYCAYFVDVDQFLGVTPAVFDVLVPDAPAIDIMSLLFPIPVNATFSSTSISLVSEDPTDDSITYEVIYTDASSRFRNTLWGGFKLGSFDNTICGVELCDGTLMLTPLTPGTISITLVRSIPTSVDIDPLPEFTSQTLTVTVT